MLVLGAMTAKLAAAVMKVPAEAARAPGGDTYTAVGTLSLNRSSVIFWVELRRPPGVSSFMITTSAPSFSPLSMTLEMNRCVTRVDGAVHLSQQAMPLLPQRRSRRSQSHHDRGEQQEGGAKGP